MENKYFSGTSEEVLVGVFGASSSKNVIVRTILTSGSITSSDTFEDTASTIYSITAIYIDTKDKAVLLYFGTIQSKND